MKSPSLLKSFRASFEGLAHVFNNERNFRLHCLAGILALALGLGLGLNNTEWIILLLVIGLVMALEIINTAVENMIDILVAEHHPRIKVIKDLMAAAVLVSALIAIGLSIFIFGPKIINWLMS